MGKEFRAGDVPFGVRGLALGWWLYLLGKEFRTGDVPLGVRGLGVVVVPLGCTSCTSASALVVGWWMVTGGYIKNNAIYN